MTTDLRTFPHDDTDDDEVVAPASRARSRAPLAFRDLFARYGAWLILLVPYLVAWWYPVTWQKEWWFQTAVPLFFQPFVVLGFLLFLWLGREVIQDNWTAIQSHFSPRSKQRRGNLIPLGIGCVVLLGSYFAGTPIFAFLSLWLIAVGIVYALYGPMMLRTLIVPFAFLLLMTPPPASVMATASQWTLNGSVHAAGFLLRKPAELSPTGAALLHLQGRAIELPLPTNGLNIALFVLVAMLWYAIYRRMRLLPAIVLVTLSACAAFVVNVLRIIVVAEMTVHDIGFADTLGNMNALFLIVPTFFLALLLNRLSNPFSEWMERRLGIVAVAARVSERKTERIAQQAAERLSWVGEASHRSNRATDRLLTRFVDRQIALIGHIFSWPFKTLDRSLSRAARRRRERNIDNQ